MSWTTLDPRGAYVAAPTGDHRVAEFVEPESGVVRPELEEGGGGGGSRAEGVSALDDEDEEPEPEQGRRTRTGSRVPGLGKAVGLVQRNTGLLLVIGAQAFFSMMNLGVKMLSEVDSPMSTLELIAVRMVITYICCVSYMFAMGVPDPLLGPKGVRLLLVTRGSVGFFNLFGMYYSLQYLSLSDVSEIPILELNGPAV